MVITGHLFFGLCITKSDSYATNYRFGFNGMEKDNEVKGIGNSLDFGARIYDSRLGKWLSLDPLQASYPGHSPYNFALNNPIEYKDPDGRVVEDSKGNIIFTQTGAKELHYQGNGPQFTQEDYSQLDFGDNNTATKSYKRLAYYGTTGYILSDGGKEIPVVLATSKDVYEITVTLTIKRKGVDLRPSGRPTEYVYGPSNIDRKVGEVVSQYDCTSNCFGNSMTDGKFIIYGDRISEKIINSEGYYKQNTSITPKKGDLGIYSDNTNPLAHVEKYIDEKQVISKGGITTETTANAGTTWPTNTSYNIYRKTAANKVSSAADDKGSASGGVRTLSRKEFRAIKKEVKRSGK